MKRFLKLLSATGLLALCTHSTQAQDYPLWLSDPGFVADQYPTSIASMPNWTATAGIFEDNYEVYDQFYNPFYNVNCGFCVVGSDIAYVSLRDEGSAATWTATIEANPGGQINNRADVQSVPQVDVTSNGDVYVSFTFEGTVDVTDAFGSVVSISTATGGNFDIGLVKFDQAGNYIWHVVEGSPSNDYITDVDYNENTTVVAIAGYVEGTPGTAPLNLSGSGFLVVPLTLPSSLGTTFPFGNAFTAIYEDVGPTAIFTWAVQLEEYSFSTDVVTDDNAFVFMSGFELGTSILAGQPVSNNYNDGTQDQQYFILGVDNGGNPFWAEEYGSQYIELDMAPGLRHSSLAIIPSTSELFFAFNNIGSQTAFFPEFGTQVAEIDPGSGNVIQWSLVGQVFPSNTPVIGNAQDQGSPTYNPNIDVDDNRVVYISGNYLLADPGVVTSDIGLSFDFMEIAGSPMFYGATAGGSASQPQATGWYTTMMDFNGGPAAITANINRTYIPANPASVYRQNPVYGTAEDINNSNYFFSVLGFRQGDIGLDLSPNGGPINFYSNNFGASQFDGLVVRSDASNGFYGKPNTTTTQNGVYGTVTNTRTLEPSNAWTLSPNPVQAGQSLFWKSNSSQVGVDQIRLMDLTGRVLRDWPQPQATAQGFQLPIDDLVPGTYLIEANGVQIQESTLIVVQ